MFHQSTALPRRAAASIASIAVMVLAACRVPAAADDWPGVPQRHAPAVERCAADLAARLHVQRDIVTVDEATPTTWPDASLGLPRPGEAYAQVLTPGWRVVLSVRNTSYLYSAGPKAIRYGGPAALWRFSAAYLAAEPRDINGNGTLYQVSLLGSNPSVLLEHVSDFWPQVDGSILAKRREGRSAHTLLYRPAGGSSTPRALHSALEFGPAVLTADGSRWVAFVRQGLGTGWTIAYGSVEDRNASVQHLQLPDGANPVEIGYDEEMLVAGLRVGGRSEWHRIVTDGTWTLRRLGGRTAGLGAALMLNRSETLEVLGPGPGESNCTRVVRRWFTGDERVVAAIEGFTYSLVAHTPGAPYVFLAGTQNGRPAAYTVNIVTGETIALSPAPPGTARLCYGPPALQPRGVHE